MHKHGTSHNLLQSVNNYNKSTLYNYKIFSALMQPSYALLPATSYPKTVGGMCNATIEADIKVLYLNQSSHQ